MVLLGWTASAAAAADPFLRPGGGPTDAPRWGVRGGLAVGLWPAGGGPRGLIRVFAPYLDQPADRIFNFIAVEPVVAGVRDLSELQVAADGQPGKPMWTADAADPMHPPAFTPVPARGVVHRDGAADVLTVWVLVEPFHNGARPMIEVTLRSDEPYTVGLRAVSAAGGGTMSSCVLTATMGNFARLRHLHLADRTVDAADVFRGRPLDDWHFFPWADFPAADLTHADGELTVSATGDADPAGADAPRAWRYVGRPAVQTWSTADRPGVVARVNGRSIFWASHAAIPGGPAFENFELTAPYDPRQTFRLTVTPR